LSDLLVDNDFNLDSPLGGSLEHIVEAILLVASRRSTKEEFWAQPPVENIDALACRFESLTHGPKIGTAINIPLGMARRLRGKRLVAVILVSFIVISSTVLDAMGMRVLLSSKDALDALFGLFEASLDLIEEAMHSGAALGVSPWVLDRGVADGVGDE